MNYTTRPTYTSHCTTQLVENRTLRDSVDFSRYIRVVVCSWRGEAPATIRLTDGRGPRQSELWLTQFFSQPYVSQSSSRPWKGWSCENPQKTPTCYSMLDQWVQLSTYQAYVSSMTMVSFILQNYIFPIIVKCHLWLYGYAVNPSTCCQILKSETWLSIYNK